MQIKEFLEKYEIPKNGIKIYDKKICQCGAIITDKTNKCPHCGTSLKRQELHFILSNPVVRIEVKEHPYEVDIYLACAKSVSGNTINEIHYLHFNVDALTIQNPQVYQVSSQELTKMSQQVEKSFPNIYNRIQEEGLWLEGSWLRGTLYTLNIFIYLLFIEKHFPALLNKIPVEIHGFYLNDVKTKQMQIIAQILHTYPIDYSDIKSIEKYFDIDFLKYIINNKHMPSSIENIEKIEEKIHINKETQKEVVFIIKKNEEEFIEFYWENDLKTFISLGKTYRNGSLHKLQYCYREYYNKELDYTKIKDLSPKYMRRVENQNMIQRFKRRFSKEEFTQSDYDMVNAIYNEVDKNPQKGLDVLVDYCVSLQSESELC